MSDIRNIVKSKQKEAIPVVFVINKIDLAPYVEFDEEKCRAAISEVNPSARIIALSAKTGDGFKEWLDFLKA